MLVILSLLLSQGRRRHDQWGCLQSPIIRLQVSFPVPDAAAAAVAVVVVAVVVAGIPHSHEGTIEPRNSQIGQSRSPNQIA